MSERDRIDFVVGEEKKLEDVLSKSEVMPLLDSAARHGCCEAGLADGDGMMIWQSGRVASPPAVEYTQPLHLEGEVVGRVVVRGETVEDPFPEVIAALLHDLLATLAAANLKRMLTTEIHTTVVNQSYDELLESNRQLAASEARYRDLAASLEVKVGERTAELKQTQAAMLQQEKMAAIGQLAAGIAHEINNPMGFIASNINTLGKYTGKLQEMLGSYRDACQPLPTGSGATDLRQAWQKLKIDFIISDLPDLIKQSFEGCNRVKKIVDDLRGFSHVDDSDELQLTDLNLELEQILSVVNHQIPPSARIEKDFGKLPKLLCNPSQISQVFLNIIRNGLQAREDGLVMSIRTSCLDNFIRVAIRDNGPGIAPENRDRVFEPFFTTREVGKGTGLGLTTAYETVKAHGGTIEVSSVPGQGAEFMIELPVRGGCCG